jgi:MraZ protein
MLNLLGEFDCTMDAKGRVRLPSGLIKQLGERESYNFVLNKGFEKHLTLYPQETWDKTVAGFSALNPYDSDTRNFLRRFHNGATPIDMDDQGRILIPKRLTEYAGLDKDIILTTWSDKIEIWDAAEYERFMNDDNTNMTDLAQKVLGNRNE